MSDHFSRFKQLKIFENTAFGHMTELPTIRKIREVLLVYLSHGGTRHYHSEIKFGKNFRT